MKVEQTGTALAEAAREVLELMCFVAAEEAPCPLSPEKVAHAAERAQNLALPGAAAPEDSNGGKDRALFPPGAALIAAQVEFRGHWTGRCMVEMPESCARMIAGNFTGTLDAEHVAADVMIELMCEFANMVCGGTITRLHCPGIVTLAPPHLIWEWPNQEPGPESFAIERWLDTGEGIVRIGFETKPPSEAAS